MMFSILSIATLSASVYAAPNVGTNPCTNGPSYWCASEANAKECNFAVSDCAKYPETTLGKQQQQPQYGSNPCTEGPSFWCASVENAAKCNYAVSDCAKFPETVLGKMINEFPPLEPGPVILPPNKNRRTVTVGSNPCTEGPSFWCASEENAAKCNFAVSDCAKFPETVLGKMINEFPPLEPGPVILPSTEGADPCTEGPSFWCASFENAAKCHYNAITGCKQYPETPLGKVLNGRPLLPPGFPPKSRRAAIVGSKPCTQGPAYWCASKENAAQCGFKVSDCAQYPDTPLGHDQKLQKCETGCPMYYLPFCGTDGNTYGNQCELDSKNCLENTN
eukprot:Pgem_evm1s2079